MRRRTVPYLVPQSQDDFGHRPDPVLRLSSGRTQPVRGTTKVHYFAGLLAAYGQNLLAFEANQLVCAHAEPGSQGRQSAPHPTQAEREAFLEAAIEAGWLTPRPGRTARQEARRCRQVLDGWLSGDRAMSISDHATYEVLRTSWKELPALPGRDLAAHIAAVRGAVLANRPRGQPRPSEHPDLRVVQLAVSAGAAGAGTDRAMADGHSGENGAASDASEDSLWKEVLDALDGIDGEPRWSDADADRVCTLAEEAVDRLLAAGPQWLHDGVHYGDRHVGVHVFTDPVPDGPPVSGFAQPFHVFVELVLSDNYPEAILHPGWAVIGDRFVLEILDRDDQGRPTLVTVLALRDQLEILESDGRDGIRFEAVAAVVTHDGGTASLQLL